jgi:hypothetical protein
MREGARKKGVVKQVATGRAVSEFEARERHQSANGKLR